VPGPTLLALSCSDIESAKDVGPGTCPVLNPSALGYPEELEPLKRLKYAVDKAIDKQDIPPLDKQKLKEYFNIQQLGEWARENSATAAGAKERRELTRPDDWDEFSRIEEPGANHQ